MKNFVYKFFLWIKDHFSFLFKVVFRLRIGETKKENPNFNESGDEDTTKGDSL